MTSFPLKVHSSGRYLVDSAGVPFQIRMDSAWSLIANLTPSDQLLYLQDRVAKGFNSILVNLLEHKFSISVPPKDVDGNLPFTKCMDGTTFTGSPNGCTNQFDASGNNGQYGADNYSNINNQCPDFTFTNATYWARVKAFIDLCQTLGLLVFAFPCFIGFDTKDHGWMLELAVVDGITGSGGQVGQSYADNSKSKAWNYGAFVANLLKDCTNIVWIHAGDYGPDLGSGQGISGPQLTAVDNLMLGIKSVTSKSLLHTAEWSRWSTGTISQDETLTNPFDFSSGYTATTPSVETLRAFAIRPIKVVSIVELIYEGATGGIAGGTTPFRKYFWWPAALGAGLAYGNDQSSPGPLWKFPTSPSSWKTVLSTQGQLDASRLNYFFSLIQWWTLLPSSTLITSGGNTTADQTYVAASISPSGNLSVIYVPPDHTGAFTVNMAAMRGRVRARWFDPSNGQFQDVVGTPFIGVNSKSFTTPGSNGAGDADWVLLLETENPVLAGAPAPSSFFGMSF